MTHKRASTCIFCSRQDKTREHVLPAWTFQWVPEDSEVYVVRIENEQSTTGWLAGSPDQVPRVKVTCAKCNNGWMSALEARCKPIFERLLKDGFPAALSFEEQRLLSRWATKTAMVAEYTVSERRKHFLQAYREAFVDHVGLPTNTLVYLVAHAAQPPWSFGISHFRLLLNPNDFGLTNLRAFTATFNIAHLGFQVFSYRRNEDEPPLPRTLGFEVRSAGDWNASEIQLWPPRDQCGVIWRPTEMLAHHLFRTAYHMRWIDGAKINAQ